MLKHIDRKSSGPEGVQINPPNPETPFCWKECPGFEIRRTQRLNASSLRLLPETSQCLFLSRWGLSQIYQDVCGPCQLQLHYSGILMNRVSKRLQQKPLNSIGQQPNEPNYKQCTLRLLEEGQELSRRIQIQINHDILCFRDFNTCSEEILVSS